MASSTSTPEALRTLRQRGSVALGVIAMVVCLAVVAMSLASGEVSLVFVGFMLFGSAVGWVLFVRPTVVLTMRGVHLNNPLRRTLVPWSLVDDVAARWNLEVYSGERVYPAWAIASHVERPRGLGPMGFGALGRSATVDEAAAPKPSAGATAGSAARLIEDAHSEWAELAAEGHPDVEVTGHVTRVWDVPDIACLGLPVAMVLLGLVL